MITIISDTLYMCPDCYKRSGCGLDVRVTYANTGGYHAVWEGRLCEHLNATQVADYLAGYA